MPDADAFAPTLTPAEHRVADNYGNWFEFMQSFGLKPSITADVESALEIIRILALSLPETTTKTPRKGPESAQKEISDEEQMRSAVAKINEALSKLDILEGSDAKDIKFGKEASAYISAVYQRP
ncbi:hypothetical protein I350_06995 [Cryptococcus amylolentus CBS 6273]|uniref:Uncharacterized protein n=1 Tax=Cryptococcus amylolentus CBS 6273 TaxID=1296118 RepID=A0A1E3JHJ2_9TREE|nr:hypothetical protein I350_06995 [Cryptococcus amylolentus CBS 6273]